jgi:hypothetical protein
MEHILSSSLIVVVMLGVFLSPGQPAHAQCDISFPTVLGLVYTPGYAVDVAVSGNYAYIADRDTGLQVVDITDPASSSPFSACAYIQLFLMKRLRNLKQQANSREQTRNPVPDIPTLARRL